MARIQKVTSAANPLVKDLKRAVARGSTTDEGWWVAETFNLLTEALRSEVRIPVVVSADSVKETVERRIVELADSRLVVIPDSLFESLATTETTQGVIALVEPPEWPLEQLFTGQSLVIVLDGVQDPGNAGAIVRAAEAFGATGVVFVKGTASPFHPRTLRASAGSLFRIPFAAGIDAQAARAALEENRVHVYAAMPFTGRERPVPEADLERRCAILIGSEGRGVSEELHRMAEEIAIPTAGVESLNAAVAAAVLLYEAQRQRVREAVRV
jgi:TrmH family RNA methyltransferase